MKNKESKSTFWGFFFKGRSSRMDFLGVMFIVAICWIMVSYAGFPSLIAIIFYCLLLLVKLGVTLRRLNDVGGSHTLAPIMLLPIPLIPSIFAIWLLLKKSTNIEDSNIHNIETNQAVIVIPQNDVDYYNNGVIYSKQGDYESAIACYTEAINIHPQNVQAYYGRGWSYRRLGKDEQAQADFEIAKSL